LRNGSGNVKEKIKDLFKDTLSQQEINEFATLVYYPEEKLKIIKANFTRKQELRDWYTTMINRMLDLVLYASSKYTR
ncbi:fructose-bisphosphatase class III, partial [Escherichia coli]